MKTKKFVSLFLAVAMIFAVLTVSVSADLNLDTPGEPDPYSPLCTGIGYLRFTDSNRKLEVWTEAINTSGTTQIFRIQAQCTLNYSSGDYDFDSNLITSTVEPQTNVDDGTAISYQSIFADANETIISFIAEYHIGDTSRNPLWDGYISKDNYVLGINY